MSIFRRREGPLMLIAVCILIILLGYYVDVPILHEASTELLSWTTILSGWFLIVGVFNMLRFSYLRVRERGHEWYLQIHMWFMFAVTVIFGLWPGYIMLQSPHFAWVANNITANIYNSTYATCGFFIMSGTFRGFRARNWEAAVMMLAGILIVLRNAPFGLLISPVIPQFGNWLLDYPSAAGFRAMHIGAGLGVVAIVVRTLIGRERALVPEAGE